MPFDSTPPEPTLDSLIAWLERQNPEAEYDCLDGDVCLLAQWLPAIAGRPIKRQLGTSWSHYAAPDGSWSFDGREFASIIFDDEDDSPPFPGETFGAALARALALRNAK